MNSPRSNNGFCVAHIMKSFLPLNCTYIYNQIIYAKQVKPLIITEKKENLKSFPFEGIYTFQDLPLLKRYIQRFYFGSYFPYYKGILRENKARLIHAHFADTGFKYLKLKKDLGIPQVTTFYGYDASCLADLESCKKIFDILFENGELFLVEGNHMRSRLEKLGCPKEKITVLHLGVEIDKIDFFPRRPPNEGKIKILVSGVFKEKKGIPLAVKSFADLAEKFKNIELLIVGEAENKSGLVIKDEILEIIKNNNLQEKVKLMGFLPHDELIRLSRECHIFLAPSMHASNGDAEGGLPVVILEMSASGLPIVSTYHCDIPEAVIHNKTGLLSKEKDVLELTKNLEFIISHPELWETMGREGRKHIEVNYNIIKQVEELQNIYRKLVLN